MKLLTRTQTVWVSRDSNEGPDYCIWVSRKRPQLNCDGMYEITDFPDVNLIEDAGKYLEFTGLRLKPGECVQVRFSVEVVK